MTRLHIDIETYSEADLKKVGTYRYAEDASTDITLVAYAFDDGDVQLWECHEGKMPAGLRDALQNPTVIKHAWNASFERTLIRHVWGIDVPPEEWRCSMVHAYSLALPGSLDECGRVIGLPEDKAKMKEGKRLIQKFCKPRTPSANNPATRWTHENADIEWAAFCEYCKRDVDAERAIERRLSRWPLPSQELALWHLDQRVNDNGLPISLDFVRAAMTLDDQHTERLLARATELTGLDNPNSRDQLMDWLNKFSMGLTSLTKDDVAGALTCESISPQVREVLELRQQLARTSVTKYAALERATGSDSRLRGCFQFMGAARTGRWAGRIFQPQNLPRGTVSDIDTARDVVGSACLETAEMFYDDIGGLLSSTIRPSVSAPEGKKFLVADFSAIEARVLAWLAGEQWRLDVFNTHGMIYEASAEQMFKLPAGSVDKKSPYRPKGKVAELACGYQGSVGALIKMGALDMGLTEEELRPIIDAWREANPAIKQFWYDIERAAKAAVVSKRPVKCGVFTFRCEGPFLFIDLPSGRSLAYLRPRLVDGKFGPQIVFEGVNQETRQWGRQDTYGGKLVENVTQAFARDCLAVALTKLDAAGYKIVGHVHDEVIIEVDEDDNRLHEVEALMGESLPWAPGLPLKADGYECKHYVKE